MLCFYLLFCETDDAHLSEINIPVLINWGQIFVEDFCVPSCVAYRMKQNMFNWFHILIWDHCRVLYIMWLPLMPTEETGETRVRTDCFNFYVSLCIQIKQQILFRGRRHWDNIFCGFLDLAAVVDCTKFPSIANVLLQLVRDIISNRVCYQYQSYEKRLEQRKGRPNVNVCDAEKNMERSSN